LILLEFTTTIVDADDDGARKVIDVTEDFGDRYAEVAAWRVPASDRYPEGVKYSMQYGNAAGETIVRYDNFPDHPDAARHHKHTADGTVEEIEFEGLRPLYERFETEVRNYGHDW
jgi:hypothetical protein